MTPRLMRTIAAAAVAATALTACGQGSSNGSDASNKTTATSGQAGASTEPTKAVGSGEKEVATVNPRALISHDGGLTLIDTETGKVVKETKRESFMRLSEAGDGRHVMVADGDEFIAYDLGISSQPHGDHKHNYQYEPGLTTRTFKAPKAGHAVPHDGKIVLFSDGEGTMQTLDVDKVADASAKVETTKTPSPHHGVAIRFEDGTVVHTEGTNEERKSVVAVKSGKEIARTDDCIGVHGEAAPQGENVAVFGCEDGPVVFRDGTFHKLKASGFQRNGNLSASEESPIVLGDHKTKEVEEGDEPEHPTKVALIDSRTDKLTTVELGASYWFRSLARGPHGEGLVLTTDGKVVVIDVTTGKITKRIDAIAPWTENKEWQKPGPAIKVAGDKAYVTDAKNRQLVVIDLEAGEALQKIALPHTPNELAVVDGLPVGKHEHSHAHSH